MALVTEISTQRFKKSLDRHLFTTKQMQSTSNGGTRREQQSQESGVIQIEQEEDRLSKSTDSDDADHGHDSLQFLMQHFSSEKPCAELGRREQYWFSQRFIDPDIEFLFIRKYYGDHMERLEKSIFLSLILSIMYFIIDFALVKPGYQKEAEGASGEYIADLLMSVVFTVLEVITLTAIRWLMKDDSIGKKRRGYKICEIMITILCCLGAIYSCIESVIWFDERERFFPTIPFIFVYMTFTIFHIRSIFMTVIPFMATLSFIIATI
jgi:hypothetical protein